MYKAVLFDFTEVIAPDGFWLCLKNNVQNLDKYNSYLKNSSLEWDRGQIKMYDRVEEFAKKLNLNSEFIWKEIINKFKPYKPVLDFILSLRSKYKLIVLSNFPRDLFEELSLKYSLDKFFDDFILSSDLGVIKPEAKFYEKGLKLLKLKPDEVVFIDNSTENIDAAVKLGIVSLKYDNLEKLKSELNNLLNRS